MNYKEAWFKLKTQIRDACSDEQPIPILSAFTMMNDIEKEINIWTKIADIKPPEEIELLFRTNTGFILISQACDIEWRETELNQKFTQWKYID